MSEFALDAFIDMPDDDDMPPLVDRPPPQAMSMMSYSFDTDFSPVLYSPHSSVADFPTEPTPRFELISEEDAPRISATKPSHAKKRDAGHIPRPPNAFILFRSSFIKSESVPGNIEGNHSTLSKIIGIVWKTLPPAERELWEKRAVQAQAEHRARYPDWRFRPGTNVDAIAKRKTKDKNKDRPPARRKRRANTRDKGSAAAVAAAATDGGGTSTGAAATSASARCNARGLIQERRCAQIAELLARGVKGVALTSAVQAWDKQSGVSNVIDGVFVSEQGVGAGAGADDANRGRKEMRAAPKDTEVVAAATAIKTTKTRSASSAQQARFNVSLTSMYRRASSVPLVPDHEAAAQGAVPITTATTSISPVPDFYPPPLSPASSVSYGSEVSFPDSDNMSVPPMFDFVPFSPPGSPCSASIDNNDICALGSVNSTLAGPTSVAIAAAASSSGQGQGQGPEASLQSFFSSYSTLCDWAGCVPTAVVPTMADANHRGNGKVVLPPYGCFGTEGDHPFSFLHDSAGVVAVADPWNHHSVEDHLVVPRPLFGGGALEDTAWAGPRIVAAAAPYA